MSLINDALKKAQQQRSDPSAKPVFDNTPATPAIDNTPATPELTESTTSTPVTKPSPVANVTPKSSPFKPQGTTAPLPRPAPTQTSFKYPSAHTNPPTWKKDTTPATPATPSTPPSRFQTAGSASPHSRPSSSPSFKYQDSSTHKEPVSPMTLWLWLGGIALVLVSIGVILSVMNPPINNATPIVATAAAPKPSAEPPAAVSLPPAAPTPEPITPPAPTPAPAPAEAAPEVVSAAVNATPSPQPTAAPATVSLPTAAPVATATPTPAPAAALPPLYAPRPPTPVNPSARVQNFINRLRVTGIRLSDTGTKVILGDRLFKIGEIVDTNLELRLIKAEQGVLTFSDATGKTYIKVF